MAKIKPFIWEESHWGFFSTETQFGPIIIHPKVGRGTFVVTFNNFRNELRTLDLAKRFAFDDFKRRLEETLGEPVGYDLPVDENC